MKHCQLCNDESQNDLIKVPQMMWPVAIQTIYNTVA